MKLASAAALSSSSSSAAAARSRVRSSTPSSGAGGKRAWAAKLDTLGTGSAVSAAGGMRRSLSQTTVADLHRYAGAKGAAAAAEAEASGATSQRSLSLSHLEGGALPAAALAARWRSHCTSAPPSSEPTYALDAASVSASAAAFAATSDDVSDAVSAAASDRDARRPRPWNDGSQSTSRPIVIMSSSRGRSSSHAEEHRARAETMVVRDAVVAREEHSMTTEGECSFLPLHSTRILLTV